MGLQKILLDKPLLNLCHYSGLNEHFILSLGRRHDICVFVLSLAGNNPEMGYIVKYLKKAKVHVIGIGNSNRN